MSSKNKILLVYPQMGMSGAYIRHIPLSLLYAAIDSIKSGFEIALIDTRLNPHNWRQDIAAQMTPDTILCGISVITGTPLGSALEMSRWLKKEFPRISVVWGGPHASFNSHEILSEKCVDFAISGYGSLPLARLARNLRGDDDALSLQAIPGLAYRNSATKLICSVPPENTFERINYRDIPYYLIEKDLPLYGQFENAEVVFPMYSSLGCPYQCTFCSSPALYRDIPNRHEHLSPLDVADHIEHVYRKYGATYIYFIDDDSFVQLRHVEAIIDEIMRRSIAIRLGFRGARINEIQQMDDDYLAKLAKAGTKILHIGAESGSQRILDLMNKNITVEDILAVNRKLANHSEIKAGYNWLLGIPGETLADLQETRELILQLLADNPSAIIFVPNRYRPLPGTEMYKAAISTGYKPPKNQDELIAVEVEGDYRFPWESKEFSRMLNMMLVTSYFIDNKLIKLDSGNTLKYRLIKAISRFYAPIAKFRYRHGISSFLLEYWFYKWFAGKFRTPEDD